MYGNEITLMDAGVITLFSMALVFAALAVISYFIDFVAYLLNRDKKKETKEVTTAKVETPVVEEVVEEEDDALVAVIAAAVAATSGKSMNAFIVRSIQRSGESEWAKAGRMELMR